MPRVASPGHRGRERPALSYEGMIGPPIALLVSVSVASYEVTEEAWFRVVLGLLCLSAMMLVTGYESPSPSERDL